MTMRFLLLTTIFTLAMNGEDITIPMDDGIIVMRTSGSTYNLSSGFKYQVKIPATSKWRIVQLRMDIGGLCGGKPRQWSIPIAIKPKWILNDLPYVEEGGANITGR